MDEGAGPSWGANRRRGNDEVIKFKSTDKGPFRINIETKIIKEERRKEINKISVGKILNKNGFKDGVLDIVRTGVSKATIYARDYLMANKIVENEMIQNHYIVFISYRSITKKAVIFGVPTDIDMEELREEIETDMEIVQMYRANKYVNNVASPTERVIITFRTDVLRENIKIYGANKKIRPFIARTIICRKCLRYNHRESECRGRKRCSRCAQEHQEEECENKDKCLHCKKEHQTLDTENCQEFEKQKRINHIMAYKNKTYKEAVDSFKMYLTNSYELLSNPVDEFPVLKKSFAETVKCPIVEGNNNNMQSYRRKEVEADKVVKRRRQALEEKEDEVKEERKKKSIEELERNGVALVNQHRTSQLERENQKQHNIIKKFNALISQIINDNVNKKSPIHKSLMGTLKLERNRIMKKMREPAEDSSLKEDIENEMREQNEEEIKENVKIVQSII